MRSEGSKAKALPGRSRSARRRRELRCARAGEPSTSGTVIVHGPKGVTRRCTASSCAPFIAADGPLWLDLPGATWDRVCELNHVLHFPEETLTYAFSPSDRPRVLVRTPSLFLVCYALIDPPGLPLLPYQIRTWMRPSLVLTVHGDGGGDSRPLIQLLPGLGGAIDRGEGHFTARLLREVAATYQRNVDRLVGAVRGGSVRIDRRRLRSRAVTRCLVSLLELERRHETLVGLLGSSARHLLRGEEEGLQELGRGLAAVDIQIGTLLDLVEVARPA